MKLTNEQTKQNGLAMIAFSEGKKVEAAYLLTPNKWVDVECPNWHSEAAIFRPKPQPTLRPWSKPEDVPLNCWLKAHSFNNQDWFVNGVMESGVYSAGGSKTWNELHQYQYSTDRKTWKPCTVEEQQ
jgi:hypothetical protein